MQSTLSERISQMPKTRLNKDNAIRLADLVFIHDDDMRRLTQCVFEAMEDESEDWLIEARACVRIVGYSQVYEKYYKAQKSKAVEAYASVVYAIIKRSLENEKR